MFSINSTIELLERTPNALYHLLNAVSEKWISQNEGEDTWTPFDVVGHLIHCEQTNWIPRIQIILSGKENRSFEPMDMSAQFTNSKGKTINDLLFEFQTLRKINVERLKTLKLTEEDFNKTATHPSLGKVTLEQLISTWLVHDLDHMNQISRVMAKQYKTEVGPWIKYLKILK
ncbi:MAG: DinB family protein [Bacteroidota bacterium]